MLSIIMWSVGQGRGAGIVSAIGINVGGLVHTLAVSVGLPVLLLFSAPGVRLAPAGRGEPGLRQAFARS